MDIEALEGNLENYNTQLSQVEHALLTNSCSELTTLRDDIKELILLTEESLLSFKKTQLLSSLERSENTVPAEDEDDDDKLNSFIGMKCRVPYTTPWGTIQHQNAIIMSVELPEDDLEGMAKVLFLTPTTRYMLSCESYMKGTCNYKGCKYSHGYQVSVSDITDYEPPDFKEFRKGKRCLCKKDDNLWAPGTVTELTSDAVFVKLDGSSLETMLTYEDVVPLPDEMDDDSDDDKVDNKPTLHQLPIKAKQNITFGGWEEHTECFGSKMLHMMGYVPGRGLGPRLDGILNPVEADIIPSGVSLDTIADLRQKSLIRTVYKLNLILKKHAERKHLNDVKNIDKSESVFSLMNNLLQNKKKHRVEVKPKNKQLVKQASEKSIRMTSVNIQNDIRHCKKRLFDLNKSLTRNKGQAEYCEKVLVKITEEKKVLAELEKKDASLDSELQQRSNSSKLKIF